MKKKTVIPLAPTELLHPMGYYSGNKATDRRKVLDKAVGKAGYKTVVLRLNATSIRLKNTQPKLSQNMRNDMKYLKNKYRS